MNGFKIWLANALLGKDYLERLCTCSCMEIAEEEPEPSLPKVPPRMATVSFDILVEVGREEEFYGQHLTEYVQQQVSDRGFYASSGWGSGRVSLHYSKKDYGGVRIEYHDPQPVGLKSAWPDMEKNVLEQQLASNEAL